ncbi:MAG: PD-(D/E)XK nuclease family protein [Phycisphaerae bacterium]|nr:PD-(D/E)XK nuclease family protein [Phycisphaerae bacterium]
MSVRFILGRAGAGKTAYCIEQIVSRLKDSADQGQHLLLLVPEQAGLQMERSLLESRDVAGFARCEVLSFRRLAHRVLSTGGGAIVTLSATGRLMALRRVVHDVADRLTVFGGRRGRRGLVERLGRTLDELIRQEVTPEALDAALEQLDPDDEQLTGRARDIRLIYQTYLSRLGSDRVDPGHHLAIARDRLEAYDAVRESLIWVDGFAGLTGQELRMLVSLAGLAARMEISLLLDPDGAQARGDRPPSPFHLFARTERTYFALNQALREGGIEVEPPLLLSGPPPRFRRAHALARLERRLFAANKPAEHDAEQEVEEPGACCRLIRAATRRVEVAAAVTEIQRLVQRQTDPLRYRDIAIVVRDLDPYHDLLTAALTAADIPHFIDRRRPIAHHALVELIRSEIELARHVDIESVAVFVKSGLAGLDEDEIDLLENYLRSEAVVGRSRWTGEQWTYHRRPSRAVPDAASDGLADAEGPCDDLSLLNEIRDRLVASLQPWWELADSPTPLPGHQWARGLFELLQRLDVPRQIADWADAADRAQRLDEAEEHRQVWNHVVELLDDLSDAFADDAMSLDDLAEVVDTALAGASLGLAPPTLDQVLVGSIERSRHPPIRAVMILGFAEGEFPQRPTQDPILSDQNRAALAKVGIELAPTSRQDLLDERLLAYIATTRPSETLWISWPAAEADGRVCHPSPFVQAIRAVFPSLDVTDLAEPASQRRTWAITTRHDLAGGIVADLRERTRLVASAPDDDRRWNALYNWAIRHEQTRAWLDRVMPALTYSNDSALTDDVARRLYGNALRTSVSRIEVFAQCPFRHFAEYSLSLEPRTEWELSAIDLGLLHHRILEEFVERLIESRRRIGDVSPDELAVSLGELSDRALSELVDQLIFDDPRNAYLIEHGNVDLLRALEVQRFVSQAGAYRPTGAEIWFGPDRPSEVETGRLCLPALEIHTPAGRTVSLRGKIDRVDLAEIGDRALASVVDYKRSLSTRRLSLDRVYHGLDLQLLTYLIVLAEHGEGLAVRRPVTPSGAFYVSLLDELRRLDAPPEAPPTESERCQPLRPRGLFDFDNLGTFDSRVAPGSRSEVLAVQVTKDGSPGYLDQVDTAPHADFENVLNHVRGRIGALCDRLLDGGVKVDPYRLGQEMACTYCPYQSVCRFEFDAHRPRRLRAISRTGVFALLRGKQEGDDE